MTAAASYSDSGDYSEKWQEIRRFAAGLATSLRAVVPASGPDTPLAAACAAYASVADEVVRMARDGGQGPIGDTVCQFALTTRAQLVAFGKLLRDKRTQAGMSRLALAQKAKLSDATVKFVETARHPPSRQTLLRLVNVRELGLQWSDTPGASTESPPPDSADQTTAAALFRLEPRVAVSLVLDAFLLLDELRRSSCIVEVTSNGARRACSLCGMRSKSWAANPDDAAKLSIEHAAPCVARLTSLMCQKQPVIAELAKKERKSPRSEIAIEAALARRATSVERFVGCRTAAEVGAQLVRAAERRGDEFREGASQLCLWSLGLGNCPLDPTGETFSERKAAQIAQLTAPTAGSRRLAGIIQAAAWLTYPSVAAPFDADQGRTVGAAPSGSLGSF